MKIGIIGLPGSGKTTIFSSLTHVNAQRNAYATGKAQPSRAMIRVMDDRITHLSELYQPKKTIYAAVEFIDFNGIDQQPDGAWSMSGDAFAIMKNADALALVLRNFEDPLTGAPDPMADMRQMEQEFILSDLVICEARLDRIHAGYQRGKKTDALQKEEKVLKKVIEHLNTEKPVRELELTGEERKCIRGFQLITDKPIMVIVNSDEERFGGNPDLPAHVEQRYRAIEFAGKFEMELSQLTDEEDVALFMADMGIEASARDRLTRMAYETLEYISFFTVGADEVRAWQLGKGETALGAAAAIHSDLARGFIRAECFTYADTIQFGSEKTIRENGRFRLEGKNYVVQDGDILSIR
ncbi:MAG: redox-regulated ATPase YchF, partial [Deltaproteobacteria bacterium]|nr:redox-regulated ATPase YchF [Deltaproteobacteria bacterium]